MSLLMDSNERAEVLWLIGLANHYVVEGYRNLDGLVTNEPSAFYELANQLREIGVTNLFETAKSLDPSESYKDKISLHEVSNSQDAKEGLTEVFNRIESLYGDMRAEPKGVQKTRFSVAMNMIPGDLNYSRAVFLVAEAIRNTQTAIMNLDTIYNGPLSGYADLSNFIERKSNDIITLPNANVTGFMKSVKKEYGPKLKDIS
ncbi:hypothetical protein HN789_05865 [archaeon]|jgi:hypothetical protein|nr:hypothetical protein [archaeon]MBT4022300.1 hypothetical protein [archaeon]MBT4271743.1 hypothetical protein [archaeon]MBT4461387.1 hypothetical protein [archaeon]MBT4858642.1 hypothetical protein [archaeon]